MAVDIEVDQPKRTRRTKAELEAARAAGDTTAQPKSQQRKARKQRQPQLSREEFDHRVTALHSLVQIGVEACFIFSPGNKWKPAGHELDAIGRPLERIYIRHNPDIPEISEDMQDAYLALVGLGGYVAARFGTVNPRAIYARRGPAAPRANAGVHAGRAGDNGATGVQGTHTGAVDPEFLASVLREGTVDERPDNQPAPNQGA